MILEGITALTLAFWEVNEGVLLPRNPRMMVAEPCENPASPLLQDE